MCGRKALGAALVLWAFVALAKASVQEFDSSGCGVSKAVFPVAGDGSGGADLYVAQCNFLGSIIGGGGPAGGLHDLFLLYDYWNSPNALPGSNANNATFNVFFQVPPTGEDYLVHINTSLPNDFQAFEAPDKARPFPTRNGELVTGAGTPWSPLSQDDLNLAQFTATLFNVPTPNHPFDHLVAVFALSINTGTNSSPTGIYDPSPAFWSASGNSGGADPAFSSAIFQLNPDGTTTVNPVVGPNGAPQLQGTVVPEPSFLWALAPALAAVLAGRHLALRR